MKSMTVVRNALLGAILATFVAAAGAVALPAASTVGLPGTTVAAHPELAGLVLEDVDQPFSFIDSTGHTLSGVVQNRVVRSSVDGTLDFYWRIKNTNGESASGDPGAITAFRVGGFGNLFSGCRFGARRNLRVVVNQESDAELASPLGDASCEQLRARFIRLGDNAESRRGLLRHNNSRSSWGQRPVE